MLRDRMTAPTDPDAIRDVNTRYHDVAADEYDTKWGIDFDETGRAQVLGKLRKVLASDRLGPYGDSLEIGAGTGYFRLNLVQDGVIEGATATDISPGMLSTLNDNAERLGLAVKTAPPTPSRCRSPTRPSTWCSATPCCTTCPTCARRSPSSTACCGRRHVRVHGRAVSLGDRSPRCRSARRRSSRPCGGGCCGPPGAAADRQRRRPRRSHAGYRSTCTRLPRPQLTGFARDAGFTKVQVRGEELLANWFGWTNRALEASADPATVPWAGASTRIAATWRCRRLTACCWSGGCRRASSTT